MRTGPLVAALLALGAAAPADAAAPAGPDGDLFLTLELGTEPFPSVHVSVRVQAKRGGHTRFTVADEWGGNTGFENEIHQIRATDAAGKALEVTHPLPHEWEVISSKPGWITLDYYLVSAQHEITAEYSSYYRAIVRDDLFHMIGHTGLVLPLHLAGTARRTVEIEWKGFAEKGWTVACSFGTGQKRVRTADTLDDLFHSVFIAAPGLRLHDRRARGGRVHFAIAGNNWGFEDKDLVRLATEIIDAERDLLNDFSVQSYLITLIPVGHYTPGSSSVGGTGLTRSFAMFMTPRVSLQGEEGLRIRYLLAHEHFHHWIGGLIAPEDPEELVYWFTEGFTDFYTRRLLYRTELATLDETIADLNRKLYGYMLSPVRNEPNARVQASFWDDRRVHELPYHRGDLVALLVDHEIRRVSKGQKSLDDLLREVLAETRSKERRVTTGYLFEKIAAYTSPAFAAGLSRVITEGQTAVMPAGVLAPCARVATESMGPYALGFDFPASRADRTVHGVESGTAAWRAGLRDGQRLLGWSVTQGRIEVPVKLTISDAEGLQREIRYLPQGEATDVPQIRVANRRACKNLL